MLLLIMDILHVKFCEISFYRPQDLHFSKSSGKIVILVPLVIYDRKNNVIACKTLCVCAIESEVKLPQNFWENGWFVGCRFRANCLFVGPEPIEGVPSMGVFQRVPSPYLREFRRKPRKTLNG